MKIGFGTRRWNDAVEKFFNRWTQMDADKTGW
jgi:hypothetical protein